MSRATELAEMCIAATRSIVARDEASAALQAEVEKLQAQLAAAQAEVLEQARVNGMGSEREAKLMAQVESLGPDAARLDWLESKLFVRAWNGVIDSGSNTHWRVADGDYRRMAASLIGGTFRDAIDAAMKGEGK